MYRLAILDDYANLALKSADWNALSGRVEVSVFDRPIAPEDAATLLHDFDIVCSMRERMAMPRAFFEALPKLKLLTVTGTHVNGIDYAAARDHGVFVSEGTMTRAGVKEHVGYGAPELAWAFVMTLARNIPREVEMMRAGLWSGTEHRSLRGAKLGLLGLGRLNRRVAEYARAFGMDILAWSRNLTEADASESGARLVSKEALFAEADFLVIGLKLGERSYRLVGHAELALMKSDAFLINISRGPIVEEAALIDVLQRRAIGGAALDVFEQEPLPADHPLRSLDNAILTPHTGYATRESMRVLYLETLEAVEAFLAGHPIRQVADAS